MWKTEMFILLITMFMLNMIFSSLLKLFSYLILLEMMFLSILYFIMFSGMKSFTASILFKVLVMSAVGATLGLSILIKNTQFKGS